MKNEDDSSIAREVARTAKGRAAFIVWINEYGYFNELIWAMGEILKKLRGSN